VAAIAATTTSALPLRWSRLFIVSPHLLERAQASLNSINPSWSFLSGKRPAMTAFYLCQLARRAGHEGLSRNTGLVIRRGKVGPGARSAPLLYLSRTETRCWREACNRPVDSIGSPDGIRTRVSGLKGRRPRPLDDGAREDEMVGLPTRTQGCSGCTTTFLAHRNERGCQLAVSRVRERASRASTTSRPKIAIDSNNGGLTVEPVTATRSGCKPLRAFSSRRSSIARNELSMES
jgi:hypothetical protein